MREVRCHLQTWSHTFLERHLAQVQEGVGGEGEEEMGSAAGPFSAHSITIP